MRAVRARYHNYEAQFSPSHDFPHHDDPPRLSLILASTPRSRSHMLGHVLRETGAFGFPLEYLHPDEIREWQRRLATKTPHDTIREIQRRRTSVNGVFGVKIHYQHLLYFGGLSSIESLLPNPHYILLTRKDLLRQAVSHSIADQTGVFIDGMMPIASNPKYDFNEIDRRLRSLCLDVASWRYMLAASGRPFLEIDTDDGTDVSSIVAKIAHFTGVHYDLQGVAVAPVTRRQSRSINGEWVDRYLSDRSQQRRQRVLVDPPLPRLKRLIRRTFDF